MSFLHGKKTLTVHKYGLNFTQLSCYAREIVKDMSSRLSFFLAGLGRATRKKYRDTMMIGDMDISRLEVYVQQVEEEKLRDREEYRSKKHKNENDYGQQNGGMN